MQAAKVIGCAKDHQGNIKERFYENPILNTWVYNVMFSNRSVQQYGANIIAKNLFT